MTRNWKSNSNAPNSGATVRREMKYRYLPSGSNTGSTSSVMPSVTAMGAPPSTLYSIRRSNPVASGIEYAIQRESGAQR